MHSVQSSLPHSASGPDTLNPQGSRQPVVPAAGGNGYVIIFRQGPIALTDEDNSRRQREIKAWAARHQLSGHQLDPRGLEAEVRHPGVAATAQANGEWPIVALVFLEARDIDEAAAIAADHPARHYSVSTEVRPWSARRVPVQVSETPAQMSNAEGEQGGRLVQSR